MFLTMDVADVAIYDSVGLPYTWGTSTGLGGSEISALRLAGVLRDRGLDVRLGKVDARALIVQRYTQIPDTYRRRTFVHLHDMPGNNHEHLRNRTDLTLVTHSPSHTEMYADFNTPVREIPAMLPAKVYETCRPPRIAGRYLYASAVLKGWDETYSMWQDIRMPGDILRVMNCGYSSLAQAPDKTVQILPPLSDTELIQEIASSSGIFYVNTFTETFCATVAMADALGTPVYVLTRSAPGALVPSRRSGIITDDLTSFRNSFMQRQDHRIFTILPIWLDLIGFGASTIDV